MDKQNRDKDIWNRLTALRGEGERRDWMKEGEGISQKHTCMTHRHRQQCGDGQREGQGKGGGKVGKGVV